MMTFIWIVVAVLAINTLLAFVLMEFAVDHSKSASGVMYAKERSWVMQKFYWFNLFKDKDEKKYPSNLCQLYWKLWVPASLVIVLLFVWHILLFYVWVTAIITVNTLLVLKMIGKSLSACVAAFYTLYKAAPKTRQATQASPTIAFLKSMKGWFCLRVELV